MQCVDNYAHALEIRLHCYKTEEVCYKAVNTSPFTIQFVLKFYKTQEVCDRVIPKEYFILKYYLDKYKPNVFLSTLKFLPDWFVTNKMLAKLENNVILDNDIFSVNVDADVITFFSDDLGFNIIDLNNISIEDDSFDKDNPETIICVRLIVIGLA